MKRAEPFACIALWSLIGALMWLAIAATIWLTLW